MPGACMAEKSLMAGVQHIVILRVEAVAWKPEGSEFTKKLIAIFRVGIENYFL
jgi:hypothetical protein